MFVSLVAGAAILGMAASSGPMFVSAGSSAVLDRELGGLTPQQAGYTVAVYGSVDRETFDQRNGRIAPRMAEIPEMGPPVTSIVGSVAEVLVRGRPVIQGTAYRRALTGQPGSVVGGSAAGHVRLATRSGFRAHIRVLDEAPGPGVWVSSILTKQAEIRPGTTIGLDVRGETVAVRVKGVYRHLQNPKRLDRPIPEYWRPIANFILNPGRALRGGGGFAQPPLLLMDRGLLLHLGADLSDQGLYRWEFPLEQRRLTLPRAASLRARLDRVQRELDDPTIALGRSFRFSTESTSLPGVVATAERTRAALLGSVGALATGAVVVAVVMLGAASVFAAQRRRVEFSLLVSRGEHPGAVGARVALESAVPVLLGAAAGWLGAYWLIETVGPSGLADRPALRSAAIETAWVVLAALILLGTVAAFAVRGERERGPGRVRRTVGRFAWEGAALALAGAALYEIVLRGGAFAEQDGVRRLDALVLLFPLLFVAGVAGLAARALRRALPRLRAGKRGGHGIYLAVRRLAAAPRGVLMFVMAGGLSLGILAYAGVQVASVSATARAKALVFTGSDVAVTVTEDATIPPLPFPGTLVTRIQDSVEALPSTSEVRVIAIDPATFSDAAYWDEAFSDRPLDSLVGELRDADRVPLPAIAAGPAPPRITALRFGAVDIAIELRGSASAFPGQSSSGGLVVVSREGLERAMDRVGSTIGAVDRIDELWSPEPVDVVVRALRARDVTVHDLLTASQVQRSPSFLALSWTFGYLEALGLAAGLVVLTGMVLYLSARQRERSLSYALARRMGLRRGSHRFAIAVEIVTILLTALGVGALAGSLAAVLVNTQLDPLPTVPPDPLTRLPLGALGVVLVGLVVAGAVAAWLVQRAADRARVGDLMRLPA